jgi:streptogramin lyase
MFPETFLSVCAVVVAAALTGPARFARADIVYVSIPGAIQTISPHGTVTPFVRHIDAPYGIAFDGNGTLYVAEEDRGIAKVSPDGAVTPFVAMNTLPSALALDGRGNLYVSTIPLNGTGMLDRITPDGTITTVSKRADGAGVAFDRRGNLFFTGGGGVIYKMTPDGSIAKFYESPYVCFSRPCYRKVERETIKNRRNSCACMILRSWLREEGTDRGSVI